MNDCKLAHCKSMQLSPCGNHHYSDCGWVFEISPKEELLFYLQEKIIDELHEFNRQCLLEPYKDKPLSRKSRKEFFANQILHYIIPHIKK